MVQQAPASAARRIGWVVSRKSVHPCGVLTLASMASLPCRGCLKTFTIQNALSRHITASPACLAVYDAESTRLASAQPGVANQQARQPLPQAPSDYLPTYEGDYHPQWPADQLPSPPPASHTPITSKWRRITVEEVKDEDTLPWIHENYPQPVATPLGQGVTAFRDVLQEQKSMLAAPYAPFRDLKEWEVVKWLMRRTTQTGVSEYLKLDSVCYYQNGYRQTMLRM